MSDDERERLRRFEALAHASPQFIAIADLSGQVQFVNDAGRRLVGMPAGVDVRDTTIADYLTPEGLAASAAVEQPAVQRDGHWTGRSTLRDWQGGPSIPVAVSSFLVADVVTGEPLAMATVQQDIRELLAETERANANEVALSETDSRHRAVLQHMSDVLVVVQPDGNLSYASPSASRLLGYEEGSRIGKSVFDLIHPDDVDSTREALAHLVQRPGAEAELRLRLLDADGTPHDYEVLANNLVDEPAVGGIVIAARDVSERARAQAAQLLQSQVLEQIANGAPAARILEALAVWIEELCPGTKCSILLAEDSSDGVVLRHAAAPSLPQEYRQASERVPITMTSSPFAAAVSSGEPVLVPDLFAEPRWAVQGDLLRRLGVRSCWSFPVSSPATGHAIGAFALYTNDVSLPDENTLTLLDRASHLMGITVDRDNLVNKLAHQATHDALTGLPNRTMLLERLTEAIECHAYTSGPAPVVVFLDLDRLKIVNDSLGHERGDELLMRIAERLPGAVTEDVLVARFGGDEFVLLCEECTTPVQAAALVENVLAAIAEPLVLDGRQINPSASAGVVIAGRGQSANEVLRDADIAMYRAKAKGGSSYQFADEHMRQRAFDRLELEEQIRHALAADQFTVFYQPIVDLEKCTIVGLEALARWQHPERGLLTPDKFIDLAEETGLIVPLGEVVLRSVATSVADWVANTPAQKLRISVNLSAKQLRPELIPVVSACVNAIAPWTLCLEITESTLMEETLAARAVLDELKGMGVEVSIDDFGTGFSSLSYLTRLQVDSLKIDRSFVWDLEGKPEAATVAQAIVSLGNGLRLQVIAEGIETETHRDWLVSMGCRYGQGYLFGKPESADRTRQLLEDEFAPRPWLPRPATAAVAAVRSRLGGVSETLAQGLSRPR